MVGSGKGATKILTSCVALAPKRPPLRLVIGVPKHVVEIQHSKIPWSVASDKVLSSNPFFLESINATDWVRMWKSSPFPMMVHPRGSPTAQAESGTNEPSKFFQPLRNSGIAVTGALVGVSVGGDMIGGIDAGWTIWQCCPLKTTPVYSSGIHMQNNCISSGVPEGGIHPIHWPPLTQNCLPGGNISTELSISPANKTTLSHSSVALNSQYSPAAVLQPVQEYF